MNITLTAKQMEALFWAIDLTEDSFDGWSNEEKGKEVNSDLATLKRVYAKLLKAEQAGA
tara:strand:+ start:704 stop:880 length:177 start_codon:yes stop_codon:yes gene_type:complete